MRVARRLVLVVAAAVTGGAGVAVRATECARAQDGAQGGAPPAVPARTTSADAHKVRGVLAWRKGVWTSDPAAYQRAAKELGEARALAPGAPDFTVLLLLGLSHARAGAPDLAEEPLRAARQVVPDFPGHLLGEALRVTGPKPGYTLQDGTATAVDLLDRFLVDLARYDAKAPFAAELRYLGHLERGIRLYALEQHDRAIRDLEVARDSVRAGSRPAAAELVRTLSEAHKSVTQFDLAESFIGEALRRDPGEPSHYYVLGLVSADAHKEGEARRWYQQAIAHRPDYAEPRAKLAYLAWEDGDLDSMRRHLEAYDYHVSNRWRDQPSTRTAGAAANLRSGWGTYWMARGERLVDVGDADGARRMWERARDEFLRAIGENPTCIRSLNGLVQVLSLLRAAPAEIDVHKKKLDEIREERPDGPKSYRDTFC